MASLRYHAGRMVLHRKDEKWHVKIKTKDGKLHFPLESEELENAVLEAENLYADARAICTKTPRCMQCIHWLAVKAECGLGFAEGRASGGSYAKDCACFWRED